MPQPSTSEKTPLGLTQSQPLQIYSKSEQIGQFPLHQHPQSSDPLCNGYAQTSCRKLYMGTTLPHLHKRREEGMEDWNGNKQRGQPQNHHPQNAQHPESYDVVKVQNKDASLGYDDPISNDPMILLLDNSDSPSIVEQ